MTLVVITHALHTFFIYSDQIPLAYLTLTKMCTKVNEIIVVLLLLC